MRSFLFLLWLVPSLGAQTPPSLSLVIEKDSAGVGEPIALELISDEPLEGGRQWDWPELAVGDSLPQGWEILETSGIDSVASPELDAGIRRSQRIVVLAWDTGIKVMEPFSLTDSAGVAASTQAALIEIGLASFQTDAAPKPMQGFKPYTWTFWEQLRKVLPWFGLLAALALFVWLARRAWKRRRTDVDAEPVLEKPKEPAHIVALRMLRNLEREAPWTRGNGKEAQTILSEAVRLHLQGSFGVKAMERTTSEVSASLRQAPVQGLDDGEAQWIVALLERSDLVKFAKQDMDGDAHLRVIRDCIDWVERTMPKESAEGEDPDSLPSSPKKNG